MWAFLGVLAGIALLVVGGTALVAGASQMAARMGVSPLIIGLTIVGFGTSSPELIVNVLGALEGETGLAFGNVVGSNIANLALVLGIAALCRPVDIQSSVVLREVPLLLLITSVIMVNALDGPIEGSAAIISRSDALVLLLLFGIFVYITVQDVLLARNRDSLLVEIEDNPMIVTHEVAPGHSRTSGLLIILGFILLFAGGELTVKFGVALSEHLGVSSTLVGLFVVAVGTSMPELVTSIIAAIRKESDLAIGNLIGSNIFNSLIVLPASCIAGPIRVPDGGVMDLLFTWLLAALLIPIFFIGKARLSRFTGVVLLLSYIGYGAYRVSAG